MTDREPSANEQQMLNAIRQDQQHGTDGNYVSEAMGMMLARIADSLARLADYPKGNPK